MKLIILVFVSGLVSLDFCASFFYAGLPTVNANFNAVFVSKNFPDKKIGIEKNGNRALLTSGNPDFQQFRVVNGICLQFGTISFESVAKPGYYLRHQGFEIYLHKRDDIKSWRFRNGACFRPRYDEYFKGYTAYESVDWPNYFIRHKDHILYIDPAEDTDLYKKDASWKTQRLK